MHGITVQMNEVRGTPPGLALIAGVTLGLTLFPDVSLPIVPEVLSVHGCRVRCHRAVLPLETQGERHRASHGEASWNHLLGTIRGLSRSGDR